MAPENVIAGEEPRKQQHLVRSSVTGSQHTEPVDQSQGSPASTDCRFGVWLIEMVGMSESVRVLRVVIASPGDVAPERAVVPAVLEDLNLSLANCYFAHDSSGFRDLLRLCQSPNSTRP
jgi:hypothetical protein